MEKTYIPIACGFHDRLLHWATLREPVQAILQVDGREIQVNAIIEDVFTQDRAEFIRFSDGQQFRLDALIQVNGLKAKGDVCAI